MRGPAAINYGVAYGLFRANALSQSYPQFAFSWELLSHYMLIVGRVNNLFSHCQASLAWEISFDTVIKISLKNKLVSYTIEVSADICGNGGQNESNCRKSEATASCDPSGEEYPPDHGPDKGDSI